MKKHYTSTNNTTRKSHGPAYPNAADNSYFTGKALDLLTAIVSGMGLISAMLFLVTLA